MTIFRKNPTTMQGGTVLRPPPPPPPVGNPGGYGLLYNYHAVNDNKNIAPNCPNTGSWRMPTYNETQNMLEHVKNEHSQDAIYKRVHRSKRQVNSPAGGGHSTTTHPRWDEGANEMPTGLGAAAINLSGFSALPCGGFKMQFDYCTGVDALGRVFGMWINQIRPNFEKEARIIFLNLFSPIVWYGWRFHNSFFAVRCVQNKQGGETDGDNGTLEDIDGNEYPYRVIGNLRWMIENLKVTRFRNGDIIPVAPGIVPGKQPTEEFNLGDECYGGILVYKTSSKYLIAAKENVHSSKVNWSPAGLVNGLFDDMFRGQQNSITIVNRFPNEDSAAKDTLGWEHEGYSDWYLPSKDEIFEVGKYMEELNMDGVGFNEYYWSSNQLPGPDTTPELYAVTLNNQGTLTNALKSATHYVRAVRMQPVGLDTWENPAYAYPGNNIRWV